MKISEFLENLDGAGLVITDIAMLSEELRSWGFPEGLDTEMEIISGDEGEIDS